MRYSLPASWQSLDLPEGLSVSYAPAYKVPRLPRSDSTAFAVNARQRSSKLVAGLRAGNPADGRALPPEVTRPRHGDIRL